MPQPKRKLRAIDLYSGVGGWSLGLRMAGIDVVSSYERSGAANQTNFKNNHHAAQTVDIRNLELEELPPDIDVVVGSPPCTQFSFSNRGGGGDIDDGMQDIIKFLSIVDHLKPRTWMMENVPRVEKILASELKKGGRLYRFRHLSIGSVVINMEAFGLPQRRRRCIAGNFDSTLLLKYAENAPRHTLGEIVKTLAADTIIDPLYGVAIERASLSDHVTEDFLSEEEVRINRSNKILHPVYNSMPFPDPLGRSVRTITATCTRVSRESIIIEPEIGQFRRLTLRERASLQGFPITFQFYGTSYAQKLRMIGNALPPLFAYYAGLAIRGVRPSKIQPPSENIVLFAAPAPISQSTTPDVPSRRYPADRRFRFAIPSLRLKSGVRFELSNVVQEDAIGWEIAFYFGNSKSIQTLKLDELLYRRLVKEIPPEIFGQFGDVLTALAKYVQNVDVDNLQTIWTHTGPGRTRPLMLLDTLDETGAELVKLTGAEPDVSRRVVSKVVKSKPGAADLPGLAKLERHASLILAGLLLGTVANRCLKHSPLPGKQKKEVRS